MPRSKSQRDQIRNLIAEARQKGMRDSVSLFEDDPDWIDEGSFDLRSPSDWRYEIEEIRVMFSAALTRARTGKVTIDTVYNCGEIQGTCTSGGKTYNVFISVTHDPAPAGCSCPESGGEKPCVHSYAFAQRALALLGKGQSLHAMIRSGKISDDAPPRQPFRPDASSIVVAELNRLVEQHQDLLQDTGSDDDQLIDFQNNAMEQRVAWNLSETGYGEITVAPLLQNKKKRGNGYTKGKKLNLERLLSDRSIPLSQADEDVVGRISKSNGYYYDDRYQLDPFDALEALVGQDNVLLDHEPITVVNYPTFLTIGQGQDGFGVSFCDAERSKIFNKVLGSQDGFIRFDHDAGELLFARVNPAEADLIRSLVKLPMIHADRIEELHEKLKLMQTRLSVILPAGPKETIKLEPAKPAILLRSRSDGKLDFGLRVRDSAGVLRRPLSGPMVVSKGVDHESTQTVREPRQELAQMDTLLSDWNLELDRREWFGTISHFADGLRLIEKLQSPDSNVEVLWDKTCENPVSVLGKLSSSNVKVDITNKRNWFGITGECQFGEHTMPLGELMENLPTSDDEQIGDYVKLGDGQWARISDGLRKRLKRLQDATHTDRRTLKLDATAAPAVQDLMETDVAVKASKAWEKCITRLKNAEELDPKLPQGLDANLRDYQIDGYKWLRKLAEWGVGGVLADDMGLGKTLQTLAVLLDRAGDGPALVIAPTSVGFNWVREAERFAPDLNVHLYRETQRCEFLQTVGPNDLVICSYGLALRDADALKEVTWQTLVLDEAQAIKNSRSKTSKAIAALEADWAVALTGTPVENHLGELWSLFHVVSPGVFGGWDQFRKRFAAPIEKEQDENARHSLAERLQPFVLRRTKSEVLTELPPRTEMNLYVDLSPAERKEYEKIRLEAIGELDEMESVSDVKDQRFKILALMTRLRQIACHAGLVNKQWSESSAKLDQLCETLESLREEGHRALIFSQFTQHLALIRDALEERGITLEYLDGSTPAKARQQAVDRFQEGDANVFLISLKAGGTGLNLTAADYVIHMDPWWNPAVEDQATDRAHRMGQDKPVMVYRIIARGTIEEEILALHESKRDLVAGVMQGTEAAAKLSNEDLIRMLRAQ